ncbi:MAG: SDR family oxidoreductase [Acidimicrobiales bacterium]|nr:SDR family oxidoreductase [Acidimicrobiales bacterium]
MGTLEGKTAIVTGATSGIGAATARLFAAEGAQLVLTGRNAEGAKATAAAIRAAGGDCRIKLGDVADSAFCDALVAFAAEEFGRVDIVANVAGVIARGDATETTDDEWRLNMAVNVDGAFFLSRAAVRQMRTQGDGGVIVNLASNVGLVGSANLPAYCASKGALVLLTKAMALDHAAEGIRINALCPGAVDTPMLVSNHEKTGRTADEVIAANIAGIPQGRIPSPQEIATSMLFLASDASSHITGAALPIDGGYVAG